MKKRRKPKSNKIDLLDIALIVLLLLLVYVATCTIIFCVNKKEYKYIYGGGYNKYCVELDKEFATKLADIHDKALMRNWADNEYGKSSYCIVEIGRIAFDKNIKGQSLVLVRCVLLQNDIDSFEYIQVLTHELAHLYYYTANDVYCEYMAFKLLYESNNEYLRYASYILAKQQLSGNRIKSYDCSYQIAAYLDKIYFKENVNE